MDFVFGTYINDPLKLANHRAARTGLQHGSRISPTDPRPGDPVTVHVVTGPDLSVDGVALYYTTDETIPTGARGVASVGGAIAFEAVRVEWDSLVWGYLTHWEAIIPPQADETLVQYRVSAWTADGTETYADWPPPEDRVQHEAMLHFENIPLGTLYQPHRRAKPHTFAYHVDTVSPPAWARDAVIYQIVIDRFDPGTGRDWLQTEDRNDFFGGTLWGVRDRLDYLQELEVTCLWLSPTWPSPTYHGYDIRDYRRVAPRLGGEEALRAVIEGAHARGMRVLLDMACNHISNEHPIFVDALDDPNSPYRDWFTFSDIYEHGYKSFFGVREMPDIDLSHPAARDWMVDNAVYWLREFDIDGYRLDFAHGPGPDFWTHFRRACKATKPDCLLFGEIIEPADVLRRYHGRLDGCLDFPLNEALRQTFGWQTRTDADFERFLAAHRAYFPNDFLMPVFLDNHDMDRFSHISGNKPDALANALAAQMAQAQPAIVLYGSEAGLHHERSVREAGLSEGRVPMRWDTTESAHLALYKKHIRERS